MNHQPNLGQHGKQSERHGTGAQTASHAVPVRLVLDAKQRQMFPIPTCLGGCPLFTKQTLQTLKQLHLCRLCTSTSHSEMKLSIGRADRHQVMLTRQGPIDIVVKKESPSLHRSSFGNLPSKKKMSWLRKSFIYHVHQFNNLKSLFGCLTRCQFFLQYLQNLQYQDPVTKKQY